MKWFARTWILLAALVASTANGSVTFQGSSGNCSAAATFTIDGSNLRIRLENTSWVDALSSPQVLTAVFFDLPDGVHLTPGSATLPDDSKVWQNGAQIDVGTNLGGEWAYSEDIRGPVEADAGIGSSGFGIFGPKKLFGGPKLAEKALGNVSYGLLPMGDNVQTGNRGITAVPLIKCAAEFVLQGLPDGFSLASITNISFQYGTSLTDSNVRASVAPEPGVLSLAALSLLLAGRRRL